MKLQRLRILLIDDDEEEYILTKELLSDWSHSESEPGWNGYELEWVGTYEAALQAFAAGKHDIYLLDYRLGDRDGLDLLRRVRAQGCQAPVVLLTGHGSYTLDIEAMKVGASDYLVKGEVSPPLLERAIRYALERQRSEEALRRAHDELELRVQERTYELARTNEDLRAEVAARKQAEERLREALEQEQAMRDRLIQAEKFVAMGRMVASVAHELNNPLQIIKNCLYLTRQEMPAEASFQEYLDMAFSETQRLSDLVTQLRELYRPRTAIPAATTNLLAHLEEVRLMLAPQMQPARVRWQSGYALSSLRVRISADQLKQVFLNICTNAVEAMQPNGGSLFVSIITNPETRQVGVVFRDSGPGIAPESIPKLFEPFFTTKTSGLGLGLAICYEIIERHSGRITVDSQLGQGATFTVWLPLPQAEPTPD